MAEPLPRESMLARAEQACESAIAKRDWTSASHHAAAAADLCLQWAENPGSGQAARLTAEARHWLDLAESLRRRAPAPASSRPEPRTPGAVSSQPAPAAPRPHPAPEGAKPGATGTAAPDSGEWRPVARPTTRLHDVIGVESAKQALLALAIHPWQHRDKARALGLSPGGGLLMYGPPGNGKTLLGRAVAGELDLPFFSVTGAEIRSKWHGESEQRLRSLFAAVRATGEAVLFLDEVDALLPRRTGESAVDDRLVAQFLAEVGGFDSSAQPIVLLGATNRPWAIDDAVFRSGRFDEKVYLPPPDGLARRELLARMLKGVPGAELIDTAAWADRLLGYTGSDLAALVHGARRAALARVVANPAGTALAVEDQDLQTTLSRLPASATPELLAPYEEFGRRRWGG